MSEVELNEPPSTGGYSVTLPTFEGPLDLLLHLCQKHELDILDIPISFVTEKYLEYLAVLQLMNLDVASEYLVMAATLAHIKSKMLLPAPPPGQEDELAVEEEDPREALIRRLLEYQKYKHAGDELSTRGVAQQNVFMRGMPIEEAAHTGLPPLAQVPLFSLVEAFQNVLSKSQVKLSHDIVHERVTLADRINELVDILRVRRRVAFEDLFADLKTRFDRVITFLALLEMTRLRMTRLFQENFDAPIYIEFTAQVTADDYAEPGTAVLGEDGVIRAEEAAPAFDTEAPPADEFSDDETAGSDWRRSPFDTEPPPAEGERIELHLATEREADLTSTFQDEREAWSEEAWTTEPTTDSDASVLDESTASGEDAPPHEIQSRIGLESSDLVDATADELAPSPEPDGVASTVEASDLSSTNVTEQVDAPASSSNELASSPGMGATAPADEIASTDALVSDARDRDDAGDDNT